VRRAARLRRLVRPAVSFTRANEQLVEFAAIFAEERERGRPAAGHPSSRSGRELVIATRTKRRCAVRRQRSESRMGT